MNRKPTRPALAVLVLLGMLSAGAQAAAVTSKQVDLGALGLPASSLNFGNSFSVSGVTVSSVGGNSFATTDTFYDTYTFTVPTAGFSSFTASLELGNFLAISNLSSRLYSGTPVAAGTVFGGNPALIKPWSATETNTTDVASGNGLYNMISVPTLAAGTYTLEVRGQVAGTAGGAYAGIINVAAVPEPSSYLMLGLGLGLMALRIRRQPN
jgi:hypothetical protein